MLKIHSTRDGRTPATEYLPAAAGDYVVGQALVFADGKLAAVKSGAGQDTAKGRHYVSMAAVTIKEGDKLPVVAANEDIVFELPLAAANEALALGTAYCLAADGKTLDSTTADGCFTVTDSDGTAAGDCQRGVLI